MFPTPKLLNGHIIWQTEYAVDSVSYISFWWWVIQATSVKLVISVVNDLGGVEDGNNCAQGPAVPVVCDTTSVVTLSCHVAKSIKRDLLIRTNKTSEIAI